MLRAALPAMRMTASMNYCDNNDLGWLRSKIDAKREAGHQCTACIAMNYRECERLFGNKLESSKSFVQRIRARDPRAAARTMKQLRPDLDPPLP